VQRRSVATIKTEQCRSSGKQPATLGTIHADDADIRWVDAGASGGMFPRRSVGTIHASGKRAPQTGKKITQTRNGSPYPFRNTPKKQTTLIQSGISAGARHAAHEFEQQRAANNPRPWERSMLMMRTFDGWTLERPGVCSHAGAWERSKRHKWLRKRHRKFFSAGCRGRFPGALPLQATGCPFRWTAEKFVFLLSAATMPPAAYC
jgi:hypothetical protein